MPKLIPSNPFGDVPSITEAIARYEARFGAKPNIFMMHSDEAIALIEAALSSDRPIPTPKFPPGKFQ